MNANEAQAIAYKLQEHAFNDVDTQAEIEELSNKYGVKELALALVESAKTTKQSENEVAKLMKKSDKIEDDAFDSDDDVDDQLDKLDEKIESAKQNGREMAEKNQQNRIALEIALEKA